MLVLYSSSGVQAGSSRSCLSSRQAITYTAPLRPALQHLRSSRACTECVLADRPVKRVLRELQPATTGDAARPTPEGSRGRGMRTVVLGAGMAGLATARVLSDFFDEVVLLERDSIESEHQEGGKRGGVPQYIQPHALLVQGLRAMESLFPGFREELVAAGGQPIDWLKDMLSWDYGMYSQRVPAGEESPIQGIGATRALLERTFRRRVLALRNVTLRAGKPATGVRLSPDKSRVTGVELRGGEALECELLVDASGRSSKLPECLAAQGRPLAGLRRDVVNSGLCYTTRTLAMPPNWVREKGWLACVVSERTKDKVGRTGIVLPIEGNCWQIVLSGRAGDNPPADEEGFKEFARSLPRPDLYETLCAAEPRSAITTYARTENERKHYESVDLPDGLAVLGDAACCFNPIYGQGMTVGILGALELQQILAARLAGGRPDPAATTAALAGLGTEFQQKLAKVQDFPWSVATADDETFLVAAGKRPPSKVSAFDKLLAGYFLLATRAALANTDVAKELFLVSHLVNPPTALFAPGVALQVARLALGDLLAKLARRGGAAEAGGNTG